MLAGIALLLVGLGFKVAAVPFHVWTPDVYQGSPTPVTAFMASVGKAAAFAALLRVLVSRCRSTATTGGRSSGCSRCCRSSVGSVLAVVQTDVKRMLAYSSISHAGFILVGVEAAGHARRSRHRRRHAERADLPAALRRAAVGTFAVVAARRPHTATATRRSTRSAGSAKRRPVLALALTVFLLAQAGVPLTSGFVAKFGVIHAAVEERSYAIAVIAMVAAVIAAFLYLRIIVSTWLRDGAAGATGRAACRS